MEEIKKELSQLPIQSSRAILNNAIAAKVEEMLKSQNLDIPALVSLRTSLKKTTPKTTPKKKKRSSKKKKRKRKRSSSEKKRKRTKDKLPEKPKSPSKKVKTDVTVNTSENNLEEFEQLLLDNN
jgi:septum formation inhibitor MinC